MKLKTRLKLTIDRFRNKDQTKYRLADIVTDKNLRNYLINEFNKYCGSLYSNGIVIKKSKAFNITEYECLLESIPLLDRDETNSRYKDKYKYEIAIETLENKLKELKNS